jgi:hypothetical protein
MNFPKKIATPYRKNVGIQGIICRISKDHRLCAKHVRLGEYSVKYRHKTIFERGFS